MDQIKTIHRISQILGRAFQQVNNLCAQLITKSVMVEENGVHQHKKKSIKPKEKVNELIVDTKQQKQNVKINYAQQFQNKKSHLQKAEVKQQSKVRAQKVQNSQPKQTNNKEKKEEKQASHPDRPKQPLSAFFIFQKEQRENLKKVHSDSGITDLAKMMGEIWNGLSAQEQSPYAEKNAKLKIQYQKQMKKFYEKYPQQKSKKQLKKEKAESRIHQKVETKLNQKVQSKLNQKVEKISGKSPVVRVELKPEVKGLKKTVPIVAEESDSESV